jgi:signal peptidase I
MKKLGKITYGVVTLLLILVAALTLFTIFGVPGQQAKILVVQSGSMEPTIKTGSLIVISPDSEYSTGDVITFNSILEEDNPREYVITHRINDTKIENGSEVFETKGDANNIADNFLISEDQILGEVRFSLPYIGYLIDFAKSKIGFVILILIPTIIICYQEVQNIIKEGKRMSVKKNKEYTD